MRFGNHTSAALLSSLFVRPKYPVCSINHHSVYHGMPAAVIAVCHGGGPMPILGDPGHTALIQSLTEKVPKILSLGTSNAPRAIVLVTAHWSETRPTISNASKHKLFYDYGGFPPESYQLKYDAPGSPEVATEVFEALQKAGMDPEMDSERGWDHGVFVPMLLINPAANIPIVQVSVLSSDSPARHFAMGQALASLRESGVAIVGSGMPTFHNLRAMFSGSANGKEFKSRNAQFSETLTSTIKVKKSEERAKKLEGWRDWVGAKEAHPPHGVEHFLPLVVCAGAGGEANAETFADEVMGTKQYSYYWK